MLSVLLMFLGLFGCSSSENDFELEPAPPEDDAADSSNQHRLFIDLQDGFKSDTVQIELNGLPIQELEGVTTSLLIGLAGSIETQVSQGKATITVKVPTQEISASIDLEVTADTYLGISITLGVLHFIVSDTPFGYG
jgi:hypothetical protein